MRKNWTGVLKIDQLIIIYHRQNNLRDLISPSNVKETDVLNVNDTMTDSMEKQNK